MVDPLISILHLEDSLLDAEFVRHRLERSGLAVKIDHVVDRTEFVAHLETGRYDIILSDYQVPTFQGLEALELALQYQPQTPFLFVSGTMGEEFAVETLRRGATDYILKERLVRLPTAVERALHEAQERSERELAEAAVRDTQERLRFAHEAAMMGVWELDLLTHRFSGSNVCKQHLGLSPDSPINHDVLRKLVVPEDRDLVDRAMLQVDAAAPNADVEFRIHRPDGELRWLNLRGRLIAEQDGTAPRVIGICLDVTDRKREEHERRRVERALAESEAKFRQLANTIPNLAWMAGPDGDVFWFNNRWYEYTGAAPEDLTGNGWQKFHHPDVLPEVVERWNQTLVTGDLFEMVFPLRGADGKFRPFLTRVLPYRTESGEISYWFGTNTDISTQKLAEEQLSKVAQREARRAELLGQLGVASQSINSVLTIEAMLQVVADEARRILGLTAVVVSILNDDNDDARTEVLSATDEFRLRHSITEFESSRTIAPNDWRRVPILRPGGNAMGEIRVQVPGEGELTEVDEAVLAQLAAIAAVSVQNVRLYESMRRQDRQKDEFLATLAHELRNPLAPIRNSLHILKLTPQRDSTAGGVCEMIDRQVNHMVRLVDDLMEVSRITRGKIELKLDPVDLASVISSAVETSRPVIDAQRHQLSVSLEPSPLIVHGDSVRLSQVFSNLLNNAAKYTDEGGQIWLAVRSMEQYVEISVRDNGIGIPRDMLNRVFELFTQVGRAGHRTQGGLGIGLSLVRSLVQLHQGIVEARSDGIGKGSEFVVRLPLVNRLQTTAKRFPDGAMETLPPHKVLVVDDNRDAANSLAILLRMLGADVNVVYDGASALAIIERDPPAVVLLDIGMPGIDGYEVAQRIHQLPGCDEIKLIALTGWSQDEDRRRVISAGFDHHLVKPAEIGDLRILLSTIPAPHQS